MSDDAADRTSADDLSGRPRSSAGRHRPTGEPSLAREPNLLSSRPTKMAIVGVGLVGSTYAYALLLSGLAAEIALIDVNHERAEGEAMDLNHTVPFAHPTRIYSGDYADCEGAAITVIAAGTNQKPGETRLDLVRRNASIFGQIVPRVAGANPEGIIVVATNPVDVLTSVTLKLAGFPSHRVFGSGTILDTARFRYMLSEHLGVDPRSVHAYIIGEHGDSEVAAWSMTHMAGMPIEQYCADCKKCDGWAKVKDEIAEAVRNSAYHIIGYKGATWFAVGLALTHIAAAILRNQNSVLTVSAVLDGEYGLSGLSLGVPCLVSQKGIERILEAKLSPDEQKALARSAKVLRELIVQLGLPGPA